MSIDVAVYREVKGKNRIGLLPGGHVESLWKHDKQSKHQIKSHEGFLKVHKFCLCSPMFASLLYNLSVYVCDVCVFSLYIYIKREDVLFGSKNLMVQVLVFL